MSATGEGHSQLMDRKGRLWQERTVVVKREENGFGFTLTQEMPVFVDKVFNGSSAQKAGIHPKDRIIKVNGISVVGHKHQEVVDMIKDSSHVTITLINKLSGPGHNGSHRTVLPSENTQQSGLEISAPRQLQELTLQSLRTLLLKQRKNYESLSVDYSKQRTEKLEKELRDCESIIRILEMEIAAKSPAIDAHIQTTAASIQSITPDKVMRPSVDDRTLRMLGIEGDGANSPKPASPSKNLRPGGPGDSSPRPNRSHTFTNGSVSPLKPPWKPKNKADLCDDGSDDDLSDEVDGANEAGPFSTLQDLKGNPAHMSVFLNYLFMSKDPKHLLFYLVASCYQHNCKSVDMLRQRGMDIYWTFFLEGSPLHLDIEEGMRLRILHNLKSEEAEIRLKNVFVEARESLSELIINDLANYRHKRVLGLAAMFGDQMVTNQMPLSKQLDVALTVLASTLKTCMDEKSATGQQECIKNQAIAACVATYLVEVLSSIGKSGVRLPSILDKIQPFTRADILLKKGKQKKKFPTLSRSGHSFQLVSYKTPTNCHVCGQPLWGVVYHGYQCCACEMNVHRYCCIEEAGDCEGQGKSKLKVNPRKTSLGNRKQNINVLSTPPQPDESEGPGNREHATSTISREEGSPPIDVGFTRSSSSEDQGAGDAEPQLVLRNRNRSVSDPKHFHIQQHPPVQQRPSLGERAESVDQPPRLKIELTRTQSERLPDGLPKQRSIEALSWTGGEISAVDEAQLASGVKLGQSELVMSGEGKQQLDDEAIEELVHDNIEEELIPWALVARREVVQNMKRYEVARQENIRELVYTERTHLHKLKIMKYMYKIPLQKQNILSAHQVEQLFPSLEELILFHSGLCTDLKERVGCSNQDTPIVRNIADVLLHRFDGAAGERLCHACSIFASNQAKAEKLCKEWKKKNDRFRLFLKNAESHPRSQRLTLTELMPIAWTRLTRYKLLIENILHSYKKNWGELEEADKTEANQVETAIGCVKSILKHVNKQVKWSTNRQKLNDYQNKLDLSAMEKSQHPIAQQFKNLELTAENRMLIHEGPLTWKIQHRKVVELHALLLTDVLVLLDKQEDKEKEFRFILRTYTVESVNGNREELSTVIRLKDCLLRTAAADRGGRTFLLVNNSNLMKLAQMYEFIAENPKEKKKWEDSIERAMLGTQPIMSPELPCSPLGEDYGRMRLGFTSHLSTREQLDKIDDDMKKLMTEKLDILRSIQVSAGNTGHRSSDSTPKHVPASTSDSPKEIVQASLEQTGEILSTVSHIMVPNPTKSIVAETQTRLTDIIHELQRNLSRLMWHLKDEDEYGAGRLPALELTEEAISNALAQKEALEAASGETKAAAGHDAGETRRDWSYHERLFAIGEGEEEEEEGGRVAQDLEQDEKMQGVSVSVSLMSSDADNDIVAPPDIFSGDSCATPTPGDYLVGSDSGTSTPRYLDSPSVESLANKASPLATHHHMADRPKNPPPSQREAPGTSGLVQVTSSGLSLTHEPHSPADTSGSDLTRLTCDSPSGRMLSILPSAQHSLRPSDSNQGDEFSGGEIPDYSLTSMPSVSSLGSQSNMSEEGTDM